VRPLSFPLLPLPLPPGEGKEGAVMLGFAYAAAVALPDMADVRLFSLEGQLVFLDEVILVDSVVDKIPRQVLIITLFLDSAQKRLTWVGNMYIIDIL
jgi:hypothetical protein